MSPQEMREKETEKKLYVDTALSDPSEVKTQTKIGERDGALGWLRQVSIQLQLRSWSLGS